jgi:hypothetical protein
MMALPGNTYFLGGDRKIRYNTCGRGALSDACCAQSGSDEVVGKRMGVGG